MSGYTVLIVPGLRDHVPGHWQTILEARLASQGRKVRAVAPMGRGDLDCGARLQAIERAAQAIDGPLLLVAHSGGCIMVAHWAQQTTRRVAGALLAAPPDFESPMPEGYPTLAELSDAGWLPVPRTVLPFPSLVATSSDDPLGALERVRELAEDWGGREVHLGAVGHLNPASGYGDWPQADSLLRELAVSAALQQA
ncbi:RBBP9/YdeN family alpha/beta hydrolase [Pseudoduganella sp. OTU4001]|uniref:RBBP9/YdeN family alpha/beta hydrolase n=1 Tax=Pseudoduganella sp. OTU4001 TaxID=3043854 RepID=UPI00313E7DBC